MLWQYDSKLKKDLQITFSLKTFQKFLNLTSLNVFFTATKTTVWGHDTRN